VLASFFELVTRPIDAGGDKTSPANNPLFWTPACTSEAGLDNWLRPEPGMAATSVAQIDFDGDRVEVFTASRAPERSLECVQHVVSKADWIEIDRVRHPSTRAQLIAARIALRHALSHTVAEAVPATAWRFARTSLGRPYIEPDLPQVHFSVSHTDGLSVVAVSRKRPVGIDIEAARTSTDDDFVRAFLSRREQMAIRRLPEAQRRHAVIDLWSLKEAYAKLLGIGLAADFKSFEFHLHPARLMSHCEAADGSRRTRFRTWQVAGPGGLCRLALAVGQPPESQVD
jgi:4'-phosphopantetheinyl transferase